MRQVTGLTSTYSSDAFGVCSALYELGGMVVMHDASGCNSTYTTHDEPRWYGQDSMIFISAISEAEAIMGDDDKFICDLVETAGELHPKFIALVGAPIPYMIGTDLDAIARIVTEETGIPCFGFAANGMKHYTRGISMALKKIVEFATGGEKNPDSMASSDESSFADEIKENIPLIGGEMTRKPDAANWNCEDRRIAGRDSAGKKYEYDERLKIVVNVFGATPLDFSLNGSVESIREWLLANGMAPGVCLSMGCAWEDLWNLKNADVNLVVSYGGLAAARVLEKQCGIPYVVGVPFGERFSCQLAGMITRAAKLRKSGCAYRRKNGTDPQLKTHHGKEVMVIGESVFCASLAAAIEADTGWPVRVLCPVDTEEMLLRAGDMRTPEEDDVMREITKADAVIADPLYRPLADGKTFADLPHEAFSGRIYDAVNPNLIAKNLADVKLHMK